MRENKFNRKVNADTENRTKKQTKRKMEPLTRDERIEIPLVLIRDVEFKFLKDGTLELCVGKRRS